VADAVEPLVEVSWFDLTTGLLGGVVVFLLGFERMTRALQAAAGSRLTELLGRLSNRPIVGAFSGAAVTAVIQSSSVTTVLTVGLVSAGVLSLAQAVGIIAGANLGTTITVQIVAFDVTRFASLMVASGFALSRWRRRPALEWPGTALLGLGLIFLGMGLMGGAVAPLRDEPAIADLLAATSGPLVAIVVGAVFTALVQSSSATVGIVVVLASQGLVDLPTAIAIALGAKIGTCVTAVIAAAGRGAPAKRAAAFHVLLNLGGALLWLPLIGPLSELIRMLSPSYPELSGTGRLAAETPRQLANAYTLFTAVNLLLVIGFTRPIARGLERLIAEPPVDLLAEARHLDVAALGTPAVALRLTRRELGRLGRRVVAMVRRGGIAALHGTLSELEHLEAEDDEVDALRAAVVNYLADLGRGELSDEQSDELALLLAAADDLEAIGDVVETNLVRLGHRRLEERFTVAESTQHVISDLHDRITEDLAVAVDAIERGDTETLGRLVDAAPQVTAMRDAALRRQADRLTEHGPERAAAYGREIELISHLYRVHGLTRRLARRELAAPAENDLPQVAPEEEGSSPVAAGEDRLPSRAPGAGRSPQVVSGEEVAEPAGPTSEAGA
jgi:phosphate:Na+ symporter